MRLLSAIMFQKILCNLFFLFFIAQILSPYVGVTIYLEILIAVIDPYYRKWFLKRKSKWPIVTLLIVVPVIFLKVTMSIKLLALIIAVSYLFYAYQAKLFYLRRFFVLSIIVAIIQFFLYYINPNFSFLIGPTNISHMIWGEYATPTFTNFYEVLIGIIRVSGLSREAGFFASLLICVILFYYLEYKSYGIKIPKWFIVLFCIAYAISFSKMSILIIPAFLCIKFRKSIDKIPSPLIVSLFFVFFIMIWYHNEFLLENDNRTFTHRFGAYGIILDTKDIFNLLFGSSELSYRDFDGFYARKCIESIEPITFFGGIGGFIITNGVLMTIMLLLILDKIGISSTGFLLLFILSMNVDLSTNQNFVVLLYYIILRFFCKSISIKAIR